MPYRSIARCSPRLLITVATRVSSVSSPADFMASASTAMIWSPSTISPSASTARQRPRQRGQQVLDVAIGRVDDVTHPADARTGRPVAGVVEVLLDLVLDLVGELVPPGGEQLDAVVGHGVVRRR